MTPLFSLALATAYHTSVVVNGEEFFFSDSGIFSNRMLASHQGKPSECLHMGMSSRTGLHLLAALRQHFQPGTYDLLKKNCNSFSDCAVAFLLDGERIASRFSSMERMGQANIDMVRRVTNGAYVPNSAAATFDVAATIKAVEKAVAANEVNWLKNSATPSLCPGAHVILVGLATAKHLNGEGAVIDRFNAVNGRWEARLHSGGIKALRAENLMPAGQVVLEAGSKAQIHSLSTDNGKSLNGTECEVIRYCHDQGRYQVRVGSEVRALRAENLRAVPRS